MKSPKSSTRDGWGLLLNAKAHVSHDSNAASLLEATRINNFEVFSKQWGRGVILVVEKE